MQPCLGTQEAAGIWREQYHWWMLPKPQGDSERGMFVSEVQRKSSSQTQDLARRSSRRDDPAKQSRRLEGKRQQTEVAEAWEAKRGGDGEIGEAGRINKFISKQPKTRLTEIQSSFGLSWHHNITGDALKVTFHVL